ncbi:MAG: hypothetical protein ABI785_04685, partial [Gemmatimonadales bacterium]
RCVFTTRPGEAGRSGRLSGIPFTQTQIEVVATRTTLQEPRTVHPKMREAGAGEQAAARRIAGSPRTRNTPRV